mmetsp:Transcript_17060/g.27576  ORF Transcript_17060/g.27576 Transcript_17060/m.27576 type:complete len:107 (+) Transcript_17060:410-730(+)
MIHQTTSRTPPSLSDFLNTNKNNSAGSSNIIANEIATTTSTRQKRKFNSASAVLPANIAKHSIQYLSVSSVYSETRQTIFVLLLSKRMVRRLPMLTGGHPRALLPI